MLFVIVFITIFLCLSMFMFVLLFVLTPYSLCVPSFRSGVHYITPGDDASAEMPSACWQRARAKECCVSGLPTDPSVKSRP